MRKGIRRSFWPIVGLLAVVFSSWLLYRELHGISPEDVIDRLAAIPPYRWTLAAVSALAAYAALAWYDRIALLHLGKTIPGLLSSYVPSRPMHSPTTSALRCCPAPSCAIGHIEPAT
jgi:uncharacterized membrane protein YbhN (UPF0104 family)